MRVKTDCIGFESLNFQNSPCIHCSIKLSQTEIMLAVGSAGTVFAECEVKN